MKNKDIMEQIFDRFDPTIKNYSLFRKKKGWLNYLREDIELPFKPEDLKTLIFELLAKKENRPRGKRLFRLRQRYEFTTYPDRKPFRPEEALERFIVVSNKDDFFGQVPIRGGKESIDIGIKESNSKFTFVELKSWKSCDSPSYAVLESLKNLVLYRIININKDKCTSYATVPIFNDIELVILAPKAYYRKYRLTSQPEQESRNNQAKVQELLNGIAHVFSTKISLMSLHLSENKFLTYCNQAFDVKNRIGPKGLPIVTLDGSISPPELKRDRWELLVNSS